MALFRNSKTFNRGKEAIMEDRLWHKSYPPAVPKTIQYEEITMPRILSRSAEKFSNRIALLFMGKKNPESSNCHSGLGLESSHPNRF
jgi:hypothetical protein